MQKSAPLPFIGQKRNFIKHFIRILNDSIPDDGEGWTIVDAFGGSGLLSHVSKHHKPKARVVYNDFDDYHRRLDNIPRTNKLRQQLANILTSSPRGKKVSDGVKQDLIQCLERCSGSVDMHAVSSWLLFSGKHAGDIESLRKMTLYNTVRLSDYPVADGYLDGLTVVKMDFEALLTPYLNDEKCLLVLDPPYVCTQQGAYANTEYFGMVEFLRLMRLVRPPFVFFSSTRSELISYLDFAVSNKLEGHEKFSGYHSVAIKAQINRNAQYEDNLLYKF